MCILFVQFSVIPRLQPRFIGCVHHRLLDDFQMMLSLSQHNYAFAHDNVRPPLGTHVMDISHVDWPNILLCLL